MTAYHQVKVTTNCVGKERKINYTFLSEDEAVDFRNRVQRQISADPFTNIIDVELDTGYTLWLSAAAAMENLKVWCR